MTTGLCLLGCIGLGAGMVYLLEPSGGPRRRALLRDKMRAYWHHTDDFLRHSASEARQRTRRLITEAAQAARQA